MKTFLHSSQSTRSSHRVLMITLSLAASSSLPLPGKPQLRGGRPPRKLPRPALLLQLPHRRLHSAERSFALALEIQLRREFGGLVRKMELLVDNRPGRDLLPRLAQLRVLARERGFQSGKIVVLTQNGRSRHQRFIPPFLFTPFPALPLSSCLPPLCCAEQHIMYYVSIVSR